MRRKQKMLGLLQGLIIGFLFFSLVEYHDGESLLTSIKFSGIVTGITGVFFLLLEFMPDFSFYCWKGSWGTKEKKFNSQT